MTTLRQAALWSGLALVAISSTSVAVVCAVMLQFGRKTTDYGKAILRACFVDNLATALALRLIFAHFTWKAQVFGAARAAAFVVLPWLAPPDPGASF